MTTIIRLKPRDESGGIKNQGKETNPKHNDSITNYIRNNGSILWNHNNDNDNDNDNDSVSSISSTNNNEKKNIRNRPLYGQGTTYWTGKYWVIPDSEKAGTAPTGAPTIVGTGNDDGKAWSASTSWMEIEWGQLFPRASWYTRNHSDNSVTGGQGSLESSYALTLLGCLVLWSCYLLLPKGIRRKYFGAPKRRYVKSSEPFQPDQWTQKIIVSSSTNSNNSHHSSIVVGGGGGGGRNSTSNATETRSVLERKAQQQHNYLLGKNNDSGGRSMSHRVHSGIRSFRQNFSSSQSGDGGDNQSAAFEDNEEDEVIFSDVGIYNHKEEKQRSYSHYGSYYPSHHHHHQNQSQGGGSAASSTEDNPHPSYCEIHLDSSHSVVSSSLAPVSSISAISQYPPESPLHPDHDFAPPSSIVWHSTLQSLQEPGIRLFAHGVTTQPRTVWLQYFPRNSKTNNQNNNNNNDDDVYPNPNPHLTWRTENKNNQNNNNNNNEEDDNPNNHNIWGPIHQLDLELILYVDVGSNTPALEDQPSNLTFSLLTRQGSLDLQASTTMERNALVSCFCILLDRIHGPHRWRQLSQQQPTTSPTSSSTSNNNSHRPSSDPSF